MDRPQLCRDWLSEDLKTAVLKALDEFAVDSGLPNLPRGQEGAVDSDLPDLFRALEAHLDRLVERADVIIPTSESDIEDAETMRLQKVLSLSRP